MGSICTCQEGMVHAPATNSSICLLTCVIQDDGQITTPRASQRSSCMSANEIVDEQRKSAAGQILRAQLQSIAEWRTREKNKASGKSWCEHKIWKPPAERAPSVISVSGVTAAESQQQPGSTTAQREQPCFPRSGFADSNVRRFVCTAEDVDNFREQLIDKQKAKITILNQSIQLNKENSRRQHRVAQQQQGDNARRAEEARIAAARQAEQERLSAETACQLDQAHPAQQITKQVEIMCQKEELKSWPDSPYTFRGSAQHSITAEVA